MMFHIIGILKYIITSFSFIICDKCKFGVLFVQIKMFNDRTPLLYQENAMHKFKKMDRIMCVHIQTQHHIARNL